MWRRYGLSGHGRMLQRLGWEGLSEVVSNRSAVPDGGVGGMRGVAAGGRPDGGCAERSGSCCACGVREVGVQELVRQGLVPERLRYGSGRGFRCNRFNLKR